MVEVSEQVPTDATSTHLEQAKTLGQEGLWYDALATVSELSVEPEAIAFRKKLLLDLADLEAEAEAEALPEELESMAVPHSQALRQIAELD